ncbi:unnamed protein product [Schistosoma mattheei]|uniref:Uncharacterized protein n=1 Tax=Schistosoma mattheei TaxID=31246 RepID=A0A183PXR8_9TREM|nr:unnamed protein product [Schistosoma mattheei]
MGCVTLSSVGEYRLGTVGGVVYGVELKLVDVPDLDLVALRDGRGEEQLKSHLGSSENEADPDVSWKDMQTAVETAVTSINDLNQRVKLIL